MLIGHFEYMVQDFGALSSSSKEAGGGGGSESETPPPPKKKKKSPTVIKLRIGQIIVYVEKNLIL